MGKIKIWILFVFLLGGSLFAENGFASSLSRSLGAWSEGDIEAWKQPLRSWGFKISRSTDSIVETRYRYLVLKPKKHYPKLSFAYKARITLKDDTLILKLSFKCRNSQKKLVKCELKKTDRTKWLAYRLLKRWRRRLSDQRRKFVQQAAEEEKEEEEEVELTWSSAGEIQLEARKFSDDGDKQTYDGAAGISTRLELKVEKGNLRSAFKVFARNDGPDRSRGVTYLEDANVSWEKEDFQLLVGSQVLNWSATEAFHPADIVNSRNYDGTLENPEKLGEPMVAASYLFSSGSINAYYFPMVLSPFFAQSSNRLSIIPTTVQGGRTFWYESGKGVTDTEIFPQFGFKADLSLDSLDISLILLQHMDRSQPLTVVDSQMVVHPVFLPVNVLASTAQMILGSWVLKAEVAFRDFEEGIVDATYGPLSIPDHFQLAIGADYGISHENGMESTFIVEAQYYGGVTTDERSVLGLFQNDVLLGYRLAENDDMGTEWFASVITDIERDGEFVFQFSRSRRLTDVWKYKFGYRGIDAPLKGAAPGGLEAFHNDSHGYIEITRFF